MKNIKTEYNVVEEEDHNKNKFFYRGIQTTEACHYKSESTSIDMFLDYTFKQKRYTISKGKNKARMINYSYELEQTISLNLELLLSFFSNSNIKNTNKKILITNDNKSKDTAVSSISAETPKLIIQLIKNIIEKSKKKAELNKNVNNLINKINKKIEDNNNYSNMVKEQKIKFKKKLNKTTNSLDNLDNKIILMNKKFYKYQQHIDSIIVNKKNNILNVKKNIFDFIYSNISFNKKNMELKKSLKKYYIDVTDLKIDNDLLKNEKSLYNDINNKDLIRCMEFYRRINTDLFYNIKKLKKAYKKIIKIMDYLNLGNLVKFSIKKNDEEANYEIEFSKINKENSSDLMSKFSRSINASISLNIN
jgi:hypothetical protein